MLIIIRVGVTSSFSLVDYSLQHASFLRHANELALSAKRMTPAFAPHEHMYSIAP